MSQWADLRRAARKALKPIGAPKKREKVTEMMLPEATLNIIAQHDVARLRNLVEGAVSTQIVQKARRAAEKKPERKPGRRPIRDIALEILRDWKKPNYAAVPYLEAMLSLGTMDDQYGMDSASSVVGYFLSNATTWKGPVAREVKKELKAMLKRARR